MDDIGTCTVELHLNRTSTGTSRLRRITHADPRIRIGREIADDIRAGATFGDWLVLTDGDVLTIRDDYGQRFIYRIHWDDYADGGYLAEWPD